MNLIAMIVKAPGLPWYIKPALLLAILASASLVAAVLAGVVVGYVHLIGLS